MKRQNSTLLVTVLGLVVALLWINASHAAGPRAGDTIVFVPDLSAIDNAINPRGDQAVLGLDKTFLTGSQAGYNFDECRTLLFKQYEIHHLQNRRNSS